MKKKILSSLIIGAFVFGIGAANVQTASADSLDKVKEAKEKYDKVKNKFGQKFDGDNSNRPEPPKDANGNPMAPPDGDNSNRPEPPKDANGNPMAPPDGDNSNRPEPPKDANGNPIASPDGDNSNRPEPPKDANGNPIASPDGDKLNDMKDKYDKAKDLFKK